MFARRLRRFHFQHRRGAVAILAAVSMMALLVMIAFAIDTGYMAHIRTDGHLTADASALAGVNDLAFDSQINAARLEATESNNLEVRRHA